jgi:hypothetical protein
MSAKREHTSSLFSSGAFWLGMGLMLTAPVMNLAYDRMSKARLSGDGSEMLPSFLATLYDGSGKLGVTLTLFAFGAAVLIFGYLRQGKKRRFSDENSLPHLPPRESSPGDQQEVVAMPGQMALQTRKYLS